ncbi:MAG: peptidylprolyl isomerase [Bacteroidota bacterium]
MSVIQKIRNKYGKLAGFIIAFALVGFILMDAASGRFGDLFGRDSSVAKVNGEKIDSKEYGQRVKDYETLYTVSQRGKANITDELRAQLHDQALRDLIYEKLISDQCEKLGIQSTKEEEQDIVYGPNPDPFIQQYPAFQNQETGRFDPQYVKGFEQQIDQIDKTGKAREEWEIIKAFVIRNHRTQKFNSLFVNSIYVPKFMVEAQKKEQKVMSSIKYVKIPTSTVNDNDIKVTDEDLIAYMKKHESQYSNEDPTRSIDYISFDVTPSKEDTAKALDKLVSGKAEFTTVKDAESFVNRNSDDPYADKFVTKKSFMSRYSDSILNMSVGGVFGPYLENNSFKMVRVMEKRSLPDSVKAQHILLSVNKDRDDSTAKRMIDSVKLVIEHGTSFDSVATKISEDKGSQIKGGDLGYFTYGMMVPEFNDACFLNSTGDMKVVKTQFGYHLIKINDQKNFQPSAKLAIVSKALFASDNTQNAVYAKANEFAGKNTTDKAFDEEVKKMALNKKVAENVKINDFIVPGLGSARDIIRWMYEAKLGGVSQVFTMDGRYIIAKLSDIQEKGLKKITTVMRPQLEAAVKSEKKADIIAAKYKAMSSLESIAQSSNQQVMSADSINMGRGFIAGIGFEPKVEGYSFYKGFNPNTVSPAIKGNGAVYFITLAGRLDLVNTPNEMPDKQRAMMMAMQIKNFLGQSLQDNMRKTATIKYNGTNLY